MKLSMDAQRPLILLVDDDAVFGAMARDALEPDYEVALAYDAAGARVELERRPVEAVLCDLVLPDQTDGVQVLVDAARRQPGALRLMVSAFGTFEAAVRAINEARVHEFFTKPLDYAHLRRRLTALRQAHAQEVQHERLAAVGEVIGGVAHELNNPLTAVVGFAELLMLEAADETTRADLGKVLEAGQRASRIVKNLAAFARPARAGREPVDLNALVGAVANVRQHHLAIQDVDLVVVKAPSLPAVWGDPAGLRQVVIQLLRNAEEACAARGGQRHIRLVTAQHPDAVEILVEDDGEGIAAEHQGRILEPFFSTRPQEPGRGMGLSVVHGIVQAHGGELGCESTPGQGSVFRIRLPVARAEAPAEPRQSLGGVQTGHFRGRSALVVDDEAPIRDFLDRALSRFGFAVRTFADAAEALGALRAGLEPDVILSDLRMPGMDGPLFYHTVLEELPALGERFVFITGDMVGQAAQEFLEQVDRPTLEKPFTAEQVLDRCRRLIG